MRAVSVWLWKFIGFAHENNVAFLSLELPPAEISHAVSKNS